jgi:TonB family protein
VYESSGLQYVDAAAINAVKSASPFSPLPTEYKEQNIDIQFTFDYNVFGEENR